jgi:hypothetical protein
MGTIPSFDEWLIKKIGERVGMKIGAENHIPTPPAIAAIRAATRHKLFPAKTDAATPAAAGLRKNSDSINEHGVSEAFCPLLLATDEHG